MRPDTACRVTVDTALPKYWKVVVGKLKGAIVTVPPSAPTVPAILRLLPAPDVVTVIVPPAIEREAKGELLNGFGEAVDNEANDPATVPLMVTDLAAAL